MKKKCQTELKNLTCGTHFGETKEVASMYFSPDFASLEINSNFTSVGTCPFSF